LHLYLHNVIFLALKNYVFCALLNSENHAISYGELDSDLAGTEKHQLECCFYYITCKVLSRVHTHNTLWSELHCCWSMVVEQSTGLSTTRHQLWIVQTTT